MTRSGGYNVNFLSSIEDVILKQSPHFTLVFKQNGVVIDTLRFTTWFILDEVDISSGLFIYSGTDSWRENAGTTPSNLVHYYQDKTEAGEMQAEIYGLYDKDISARGRFYISMSANRSGTSGKENDREFLTGHGVAFVRRAAVGNLTEEELANAPDIKEQLFSVASEPGGGFAADFYDAEPFGVSDAGFFIFTIQDVLGQMHYCVIFILEAADWLKVPYTSLSVNNRDPYFRILSALPKDQKNVFDWDADYEEDSYYLHGYQTVFENVEIEDGTVIYPEFNESPYADIYAGLDQSSGTKQISGESGVVFRRNQPIRYSAAMEDGEHLKNYWVTVVPRETGGAKLFVNAASNIDEAHRDRTEKGADGKGLPVREVFFNTRYDYLHDIIIANTGDEELTGLSVKLVGSLTDESVPVKNICLDTIWTLGEGTVMSLAPFDSHAYQNRATGGWKNMTKIRLLPITDENGNIQEGEISGYLIITSDNGGSMTVKLTGEAGEPRIVTETLETVKNRSFQAVRFVHYSTFLQTSSMYAKDKVKFTLLDGELPKGVTEDMDVKLSPNGELYGVPAETGTYEFVVRATFYGDENCYDDKTYTLIVADNTDANVSFGTGISDYQLLQNNSGDYNPAVGYDPASGDLILHSEAPFNLFVDKLVLDGEELRPGIDYTAMDGSVIAQIRNLASRLSGNANHTLSLENRAGGKTNQATKLTRTSVNVRTTAQVSTGKSGGSSTVKTVTKTPSRTAYAIHVSSASNGTVNVSASAAVSGKTVTITPNPNAGFTVQSVTVSGENIKGSVTVKKSGGKYTFTMPAKQVRVRVRFTDGTASANNNLPGLQNLAAPETMPEAVDMKSTDWYYSDAVWAYDRGILRGYQDSTFRAGTLMHWVSAVVTLERLDGVDVAAYDTGADDGLNNSAWYVGAARWAVDNGIAPAPFREYAAVTRGQYAVMLRNYLRFSGVTVTVSNPASFPDGDRMTAEEIEAFQILSQAGVFQGDSSGAMLPGNTLTRAHLAATLHRLSQYIIGYWEAKAGM